MTEDEARMKRCCGPIGTGELLYPHMSSYRTDEKLTFPRQCIGSACMAWRWLSDGLERVTTRNLTDDQETMSERIRSHPTERSIWKKPEGEPPTPPGDGWLPMGEMRQATNYADGVFERTWERQVKRHGYCGLAGKV